MFANKDIFDSSWNNAKGEFMVDVPTHPGCAWSFDCRDVLAAREVVLKYAGAPCPIWYYPPHGGPVVKVKPAEVQGGWEYEGSW